MCILESHINVTSGTTTAIVIRKTAVNKLLDWKWNQSAIVNFKTTLKWPNGWKSPVWTAIALVLNRGHCSLKSPIYAWRDSHRIKIFVFYMMFRGLFMGTVYWVVFFKGPVCELIEGKSESVIWILVNFYDLSKVSLKYLLSLLKLLLILIWLAMHSHKS